jgi:hypothetical protein
MADISQAQHEATLSPADKVNKTELLAYLLILLIRLAWQI